MLVYIRKAMRKVLAILLIGIMVMGCIPSGALVSLVALSDNIPENDSIIDVSPIIEYLDEPIYEGILIPKQAVLFACYSFEVEYGEFSGKVLLSQPFVALATEIVDIMTDDFMGNSRKISELTIDEDLNIDISYIFYGEEEKGLNLDTYDITFRIPCTIDMNSIVYNLDNYQIPLTLSSGEEEIEIFLLLSEETTNDDSIIGQPKKAEEIDDNNKKEIEPENDSIASISGYIEHYGVDVFSIDDINLILYMNNIKQDISAEIKKEKDGSYSYTFYDLPVLEGNNEPTVYTIRDGNYHYDSSCLLYYISSSFSFEDIGYGVPIPANLIYVEKGSISGIYRIEKDEDELFNEVIEVEISADELVSTNILELISTLTLKPDDNTWSISNLPLYNPYTGEGVNYYAVSTSIIEGFEILYENTAPYETKFDGAYDKGTIISRSNTLNSLLGFDLLGFYDDFDFLGDDEFYIDSLKNFTASIYWNDDNDEEGRPQVAIRLMFRIPGLEIEEFVELTSDILADWLVKDVDDYYIDPSILNKTEPTSTTYNSWEYLYEGLPAALRLYTEPEEGEDPDESYVVYNIEYSFEIINLDSVAENYFIDKQNNQEIILTKKTEVTFEKIWKDSNNNYNTRPDNDTLISNLSLYRIVNGNDEKIGLLSEIDEDFIILSETGDNSLSFNILNLPMYDSDGHTYFYYILEEDNSLAIAEGSEFEDETVRYTPRYENISNNSENHDMCFDGGVIINTLTDSFEYKATKKWQDDGQQNRPSGTFYLYRYPNLPSMDYTKATPVLGMQIAIENDNTHSEYEICYNDKGLLDFPEEGLPRFDGEGNEYVYFVQEILTGAASGNYTRFYDYGETTPPDERYINALFSGGTLQNRRTGTVDVPVTKSWKAAARQDMDSSVELHLSRRLKNSNDEFEEVQTYIMDGFRAEIMTQTYIFEGMPQFNEAGLEYEYVVEEYAITIGSDRVLVSEARMVDGKKLCDIGGYTYELKTQTDSNGAVTLINQLIGTTEVHIEKVYNGQNSEYPWSTVTFSISTDNGVISQNGVDISVNDVFQDGLYLEVEDTRRRVETGSGNYDEGSWLIVSGLPRYDEQGREIKYSVNETARPNGYTVSYNTVRKEIKTEDGHYIGIVETTVTNTPTGGGTHIEIRKQWLDDGDENCRGSIIYDLYYLGEEGLDNPATPCNSITLTSGNDWWGWIGLNGLKVDGTTDNDHAHYYVKERSIAGVGGPYSIIYLPEIDLKSLTSNLYIDIGTVTTDNHHYDVQVMRNGSGTQYTFRNIRKGTVNIEIDKRWVDYFYQEKQRNQEVTLEIRRWLNYTDPDTASRYGDPIILNGKEEPTPWCASVENLPKYDERGVLYHYTVVETSVKDLVDNKEHSTIGGSYTLDDDSHHHYVISVDVDSFYGEHNGGTSPQDDLYEFHVTNTRSETINFKVYKLWRDITRNINSEDEAAEKKYRPDIYLVLYQKVEGEEGWVEVRPYVERVWDTAHNDFNEYYWECDFDPLPRYTSDGREITYAVEEVMTYPGEYIVEYHREKPTLLQEEDSSALSFVTTLQIWDLSEEPVWSSKDDPDNEQKIYVENEGTILNRREAERTLSGQKIWKNVPANLSSELLPEITLQLHIYKYVDSSLGYVFVAEANMKIDLEGNKKNFIFTTTGDDTLPRYDKYGTIIKYQAHEVSEPIDGYATPVYDDYNLIVTNEYKIDPAALEKDEKVSVSITKQWDLSLINNIINDGFTPIATIQLYRQLTDINGSPIEGTQEYTSKFVQIAYPNTTTGTDPVFNDLPKYGYNGNEFYYYLVETLNGYTVTGLEENTVTNDNSISFSVKNTYTGKEYVKLSGTKEWADSSDLYKLRPQSIELKVYRKVTGSNIEAEDITDRVNINWINTNTDVWTYTVTAKQLGANGIDVGDSSAGETCLFRYAPNGALYIYFVEEVKPNHHYLTEGVVGAEISNIGSDQNLTLQAVANGNNRTASFINTLETVDYSFYKEWQKETEAGVTVPITAAEFRMMLPKKITFKIQYKDTIYDAEVWLDYIDNDGTVVREFSYEDFIPQTGNNRSLVIAGLPKYDKTNEQLAVYRAVEIKIEDYLIDDATSSAGGFRIFSSPNEATITNQLQTVALVIKKEWRDDDNNDGLRFTSLTFRITRDKGTATEESIDVSYTLPNNDLENPGNGIYIYVPKYLSDGVTESKYTIEEILTDSQKQIYTLVNHSESNAYALDDPGTEDSVKTYEFKNEHDMMGINISVKKIWDDSTINTTIGPDNISGIHPLPYAVTLTLQVFKDNIWVDVDEKDFLDDHSENATVVINEEVSWEHEWKDLIARNNSGSGNNTMQHYQYRVVEEGIFGYTATYRFGTTGTYSEIPTTINDTMMTKTGNGLEGTISISNRLETISLSVEKIFDHSNSPYAEEPDIDVLLVYRLKGQESWTEGIATRNLNKNNNFKATFSGLPKENNKGELYEYSVKETKIGSRNIEEPSLYYYSYDIKVEETNDQTSSAVVTNTLICRNDITVTKIWDDNNNQDGVRPDEITINLIKDMGETFAISSSLVLNESNSWSVTFSNLPKYRPDGNECTYHLKEQLQDSSSYTVSYKVGDGQYYVDSGGSSEVIPNEEGITVEVKNSYTPKLMKLTVVKDWNDQNNIYLTRPESIKLQLYKTTTVSGEITREAVGEAVTLILPFDQHTWSNLPIKENTTATGLTKGNCIDIYYSVEELSSPYIYSYLEPVYEYSIALLSKAKINDDGVNGSILDTDGTTHNLKITNTLDTVEVMVRKIWEHNDSVYAQEPDVVVQLLYRLKGVVDWQESTATLLLNPNNSFSATFRDLPRENSQGKEYEYTVKEISIGENTVDDLAMFYSYEISVEQSDTNEYATNVTNTLICRTDIIVTKEWDDNNNQDGIRPNSITVNLIKDMGETFAISSSLVLNERNSWSVTFSNLPKYRPDGNECTYHLKEQLQDSSSYTASYKVGDGDYDVDTNNIGVEVPSTSADITISIKNLYIPKLMNLSAIKIWDDEDNRYDTRPSSIILQLYKTIVTAGITETVSVGEPKTLTLIDTECIWENLPIKENPSGTETTAGDSRYIYYSVIEFKADSTEVPIYGYQMPIYEYEKAENSSTSEITLNGIRGSLADTTATTHIAKVTNSLDTVDIIVEKIWSDFQNIYGLRPTSIKFQLQRRVLGSNTSFENMYDANTNPLILAIECGNTLHSQQVVFLSLPKYTPDNTLYEYRAVEISYSLGEADIAVTLNTSTNVTTGHYEYEKNSSMVKYDFSTEVFADRTEITNELSQEGISLSGTKYWDDMNNRYLVRPSSLEVVVYHKTTNGEWEVYPNEFYEIVWTKDEEHNRWDYLIPSLPKYEFGKTSYVEYAVAEVLPQYYNQSSPEKTGTNPNGLSFGLRDAVSGNISMADLVNAYLSGSILSVEKEKNRGPENITFTFKVYVSNSVIDENNTGIVYTGDYRVFASGDNIFTSEPVAIGNTTDGNITITAKQVFVLNDLPIGFYYSVVEDEHSDFVFSSEMSSGMNGQLSLSTDSTLLTTAYAYNLALTELSIINATTNPGIGMSHLSNVGGLVTVVVNENSVPYRTDIDPYKEYALDVMWQPNEFWVLGDSFILRYTEFGETEEKSIIISGYIDTDGNLLALTSAICSDPDELERFLLCGAYIEIIDDRTVLLHLAENVNDMPRLMAVEVLFIPTLGIHNITHKNAGGTVKTKEGIESNISDGVPAFGGTPYDRVQTVNAAAEKGFSIATGSVFVRNLNDLNGTPVKLNILRGNSFIGILPTNINGSMVDVMITGSMIFDYDSNGNVISMTLEFDSIPIPLQVDILFEKINYTSNDQLLDLSQTGSTKPNTGDTTSLLIYPILIVASLTGIGFTVFSLKGRSAKKSRKLKHRHMISLL